MVRRSGRATVLVIRHIGDGKLCLHWISARCRAGADPWIAFRTALNTRRRGRRARPGYAEVVLDQIRSEGLDRENFPVGVVTALRAVSSHVLMVLLSGCDRTEPEWAREHDPLTQEEVEAQDRSVREFGNHVSLDGRICQVLPEQPDTLADEYLLAVVHALIGPDAGRQ